LCLWSISFACSSVVPTGTVMSSSFVIRSETGSVVRVSKRRSRLVRMPTRRPSETTGSAPYFVPWTVSAASRSGVWVVTVTGFWIMMREIVVSSITRLKSASESVSVEGSARLRSPSVRRPTRMPPTVTGSRLTPCSRMISRARMSESSGSTTIGFGVM